MSKYNPKIIQFVADKLSRQGQLLIKQCYEEREFNNDTYNLHDSYGCCVYYDGKEVKGTRYFFGEFAKESKEFSGKMIDGREEINHAFDTYKATPHSFELLLAVAMPYAPILENGGGLKRKYKVISMSYDKLEKLGKDNAKYFNKYAIKAINIKK